MMRTCACTQKLCARKMNQFSITTHLCSLCTVMFINTLAIVQLANRLAAGRTMSKRLCTTMHMQAIYGDR